MSDAGAACRARRRPGRRAAGTSRRGRRLGCGTAVEMRHECVLRGGSVAVRCARRAEGPGEPPSVAAARATTRLRGRQPAADALDRAARSGRAARPRSAREPADSAAACWPSSLGDVAQEGLDQVGLLLRVVGRAGEGVGHEDDRVGARLGRVAGQVEGEAGLAAALDPPGDLERPPPRPRGEYSTNSSPTPTFATLEVTDLAGVGVADGAVAALDRPDDARGALRAPRRR